MKKIERQGSVGGEEGEIGNESEREGGRGGECGEGETERERLSEGVSEGER